MKQSSRQLSLSELLDILQYEYLCCLIRVKTYVNEKHINYWKRVSEFKKEKIKDIASKQQIPCIFDHNNILELAQKNIYSGYGLPSFVYKDEVEREKQEKWDILNFFYAGTEIVFYAESEIKKGKIVYTDVSQKTIQIIDETNKEYIVYFENTTRHIW